MEATDIFLIIAAVIFGLATIQPSTAGDRLRFGVALVPLGLLCVSIAFLVQRN